MLATYCKFCICNPSGPGIVPKVGIFQFPDFFHHIFSTTKLFHTMDYSVTIKNRKFIFEFPFIPKSVYYIDGDLLVHSPKIGIASIATGKFFSPEEMKGIVSEYRNINRIHKPMMVLLWTDLKNGNSKDWNYSKCEFSKVWNIQDQGSFQRLDYLVPDLFSPSTKYSKLWTI